MSYILPCGNVGVSDNFAAHVARGSVNPGTDYVVGIGTPVHAADAGTVINAQSSFGGSGGRLISIRHANGDITDYLHLSRVDVSVGSHVSQGQQIGLSGASADGSEHGVGPHLHISLHTGPGAQALTRGGSVDFQTHLGTSAPASSGSGHPTLQNGSTGPAVSTLQSNLNRVFPAYSKLAVDGQFGPATAGVVKEFQHRVGITADGIVGPVTWSKLAGFGAA